MTSILGISAYYHDSAAALVIDGNIVGAAQEERFTRVKGDSSFPHHAVGWCLHFAGLSIEDVDHIVFYERPLVHFERLMMSSLFTAPRGLRSFIHILPDWLTRKLWLEKEIAKELGIDRKIDFVDHHRSHAASAFYPSPFSQAAILTVDGVGEWSTATWGVGTGNEIELKQELRFPNSLGLLYSAFTYYCGFKINSGEYKLMGLAPYGRPLYAERILQHVVHLMDDGTMLLNQDYFGYATGLVSTTARFHQLFEGPPRQPETRITQREMDLAASIQVVINEALLRMGRFIHYKTGMNQLVLAGGVALNCVATGHLSTAGPFDQIWTQPAAGDAGGALGAALSFWHRDLNQPRLTAKPDGMHGAFLGPDIPPESPVDDAVLEAMGAVWDALDESELQTRIATDIAAGKVVAVARGRMEFGPRALGARSILGDARSDSMQTRMNLKVKFRESFRPFAPMVLAEDADRYFDCRQESPYMLLVYPVTQSQRKEVSDEKLFGIDLLKQSRSQIPAITHVDYSARLQTIDPARNPFVYGVLTSFKQQTGCSVIVNTSFNVRGEPIVNTAEDAYRCFMATEIDSLIVGNRYLERTRQPSPPLDETARAQWLQRFELD
ncbi:carbamoyltransferase [Schlesneria sp. T3-172]|uniref:carbamoyltransferase family protein n=1 Tax=Schlesneria sphaerica TaxID=3373610 RepID=UPI0037CC18FF